MIVAALQLELELDAPEERRGRMEDESVAAGIESVCEARAAVVVGLCLCDRLGAMEELDRDSCRRPPGGRVEDVGREETLTSRTFALARDGPARSPPRRRSRAGRRGRPSRLRRRACRLGEGLRGRSPPARSSAPPSSSPSVRHTAKSAHFPVSSEPMSSRRSTAAPPRVPSRIASRAVSAAPPSRPRATRSACLTSRKRSPRSLDAEPSTPSPTRTPASSMSRTGATPAPSLRFEDGQWATPVPVAANLAMSRPERWTQCAHQTSSASQPNRSRYSTGRHP